MIPVAGKTVLRRLVEKFNSQGVSNITVVAGYRAEAIDVQGIRIVIHNQYSCLFCHVSPTATVCETPSFYTMSNQVFIMLIIFPLTCFCSTTLYQLYPFPLRNIVS